MAAKAVRVRTEAAGADGKEKEEMWIKRVVQVRILLRQARTRHSVLLYRISHGHSFQPNGRNQWSSKHHIAECRDRYNAMHFNCVQVVNGGCTRSGAVRLYGLYVSKISDLRSPAPGGTTLVNLASSVQNVGDSSSHSS